ncbi:MAG: membrane protein insertase YidC [Candidatus Marinimicrobia bacterium]|nr:membrane protein insertase YidC [Candidatus Neomarinimicrobiota bacterium]
MDKNSLFAFLLIAIILIFTPKYMEMVAPTPPQTTEQPDVDSTDLSEFKKTEPILESSNFLDTIETHTDLPQHPEQKITIETDLYDAVVSSRGGGSFLSFSFKNYFDHDSQQVDLINGINKENLSIWYKNLDGDAVHLNNNWRMSGFRGGLVSREEILVFTTELSSGKTISKTLTFYPDSYIIDIDIDTKSASDQFFSGVYSLGWKGGLTTTEKNIQDDLVYFKSYVFQGGELEDMKVKKGDVESTSFNGATDWVAIRTKYFITAFIPEKANQVASASIGGNYNEREAYNMELSLPASSPSRTSLYLGPLEYERIKNVDRELDRVMNFGIWPVVYISKAILWTLKKLHEFIPNYGYILIIFAFAVKILVYPLTKKSYQSTAAMQKIQPELAALKEKYKNNAQKLNQATMQMYKEKGVNPLGGCLPMLLQMPLLFALFVVFRTTIELRAEPFIFWIKDLSAPDAVYTLPFSIPIYGEHVAILPVLMVVSMFIQQRMMSGGAAQQPQQKTMQYFMTGFFFLMFNSFPSGLNLYYTLFNVLTIAQQMLIPPEVPVST